MMRFIQLVILAMYFSVLSSFAQHMRDSIPYYNRKLRLEEINFVSGYYRQDGNNSAVTGGIGTQNLADASGVIDIKLSKYDKKYRNHSLDIKLGIDDYTSASSAHIGHIEGLDDVLSAASRHDRRIYPSVTWSVNNPKSGLTYGLTGYYSHEYHYESRGLGLEFSQLSRDQNREFSFKGKVYLDTWADILPVELRPPGYGSGNVDDPTPIDHSPRNSFSALFLLSQVINRRMQVALIAEPSYQHGLLAIKIHRVYFIDGSEKVENLPDSRYKLPISLRTNYFLTDRVIIRSFYRFYVDNWGINAHTAELEVPFKITPFFSVSPFYRLHMQHGTRYFAPYGMHTIDEPFYTSDYDLSTMTSNYLGGNVRIAPPRGILGWNHLNAIELRYGHYLQSNGLNADSFGLGLTLR